MLRLLIALPLALALLAASACGDDDGGPSTPADATYQTAGVVEALPREGADRPEISIAHEDLPTFVNREGEQVGMQAMTMQFVVGEGVDLEGVEVGDSVSFTFEVRWNARPMLLITRLEER